MTLQRLRLPELPTYDVPQKLWRPFLWRSKLLHPPKAGALNYGVPQKYGVQVCQSVKWAHPVWPDDRGVLCQHAPREAVLDRSELRTGRQADEAVPDKAVQCRRMLRDCVLKRWSPQCDGWLRRDSRRHGCGQPGLR